MLHDPRHDKTPSMAGFALFVASKNPKGRYNWRNCEICPVGEYLHSIGQYAGVGHWSGVLDEMNSLARGKHDSVIYSACGVDPEDWTFGALADRILAHQMAA
jgi:hypothetical protein